MVTCVHFFSEGAAAVWFKQRHIERVNHYRDAIGLPPIHDIPK
jgi:hypothetical protein